MYLDGLTLHLYRRSIHPRLLSRLRLNEFPSTALLAQRAGLQW